MNKDLALIVLMIISVAFRVEAQLIINPVVESKTHPSLKIDSIRLNQEKSVCYLSVTNENTQGTAWFCADRSISLIDNETLKKYELIESKGIPVCPEKHQFNAYGEKLSFELTFPPIPDQTKEIDVIENCSDNCFLLKGIVLDLQLNKEIRLFEEAAALYKKGEPVEALKKFTRLSSSAYKLENYYAYTLYIVPLIHFQLQNYTEARKGYQILESSNVQEKQYFLRKLNEEDFSWKKE